MTVEITMKISSLFEILNTHYFFKNDKAFFAYINESKKINEVLKETFKITDSSINENLKNDKRNSFISNMMNKKLEYKKKFNNIKFDNKNIDLSIMLSKRKEKQKKVTHLAIDLFIKENNKEYIYYHIYFHNTIENKEFKSVLTLTKKTTENSNIPLSGKLIKNDLYCSIVSKQNREMNMQEVSLNEIKLYSEDNNFTTPDRSLAFIKNPKIYGLPSSHLENILFFGGIDSITNDFWMLLEDNFEFSGYSKDDNRSVFDIVAIHT